MDELEALLLEISSDIIKVLGSFLASSSKTRRLLDDEDYISVCGPAILRLLLRQAHILCSKQGDWALLDRRLDDLQSFAKEKLYDYPFKDVPKSWRRLFTDASILKACSAVVQSGLNATDRKPLQSSFLAKDGDIVDIVTKLMDLAIIMAGAPEDTDLPRREWIDKILDLLEPLCKPPCAIGEARPSKRQKLSDFDEDDHFPASKVFVPPVQHPVARAVLPAFHEFEKHMNTLSDQDVGPRPLVIKQVMEHWPARYQRPWKRPSYLLSKTLNGRRLVPIEVGRSYVDKGWGQKIVPFREFLRDYLLQSRCSVRASNGSTLFENGSPEDSPEEGILPRSVEIGYLAQHDLFTQIPSLRLDIRVPDYCYTSAPPPHPSSPLASKHKALPTLEEPLLNAWLGPGGTISPMHVDPYHNLLAQVVGSKYVRLYPPKESLSLYPRGVEDGGVDMSNTSALDIGVLEGWDGTKDDQKEALRKYPLYSNAEYVDLILEEGECLYIPLGWWHYVRSLTVSFSVSFWWN